MFKVLSFTGTAGTVEGAADDAALQVQRFIDRTEELYPGRVIGVSISTGNLVETQTYWAQVLTVVVEIVDEREAGHANEYVVNLLKEAAV